jgi:hypothetical protein
MLDNIHVFEDGTTSPLSIQELNTKELERQRWVRVLCPDKEAVTLYEMERLLQRDVRAGTPGASCRKLQPFHWQEAPELPRYVVNIASPKLDITYAHSSRVGSAVGSFCGSPIVELDEIGMEVDVENELQSVIKNSTGTSIAAEVLPGEEICTDNIIRRTTTAEAQGDAYYKQEKAEENTQKISIAEAQVHYEAGALLTWRPDRVTNKLSEYALLHEEAFA